MLDRFGRLVANCGTTFIEPAWKMLWSNKAILIILWELYPDHPLLVPAAFTPEGISGGWVVRKPFIGREGANVAITRNGEVLVKTDGPYRPPYVYQQYVNVPCLDGNCSVVGSWVIDGQPAGIGIREDDTLITGNNGRFVPHTVEG